MYHWLLHLYPSSFRHEYGDEMARVFARRRREARTPLAAAVVWGEALVDTLTNAAIVHVDLLAQDLRYAWRTVVRMPGFALTAIVIVSLGIGATTAAFSVTDFVLIRPLPFPAADRLVAVWEKHPGYLMELSPANYRDWKRMMTSFDGFAAFRGLSTNLVGAGEPQRIEGAVFTHELLPMLGIAPLIGRSFASTEDQEGAPGTVLLSYQLWQSAFGGAPSIVGSTVRLDDRPYTVIGVMPREFRFPSRQAQLWTPMRFAAAEFEDRNDNYLHAIARLRRGVSFEGALAELNVAAARLKQQYPAENARTDATLIPIREEVSGQARLMLIVLLAASACVLLISCANLASLLLARALARRREVAVRAALGAGRDRLVRQLLTESLVLAGAGGLLGVAVAWAAVPLLARLVPMSVPLRSPTVDLRVLVFAGLTTAATGILFGMAPIVSELGDAEPSGLREGTRAGGGRKERLRGALVAAEITASVVLLVACGLLMRALWRIQAVDPGFRSDGVLTLRTSLPMPKYEATARRVAFYTRVLSEARALPGVSSAAYVSFLPMSDMRGGIFPVGIGGVAPDRRENQVASLRYTTPDYFRTMGIPLLRGRDFEEADAAAQPSAAIVSDSFVRRYWPDQDPIGRQFRFVFGDRTVVGVVGDVKVRGLVRTSEPQVYLAYRQVTDGNLTWYAPKDLVVRTQGDPEALLPSMRAIIRSADAEQPISNVRTLTELVEEDTASRTAQMRVVAAFALVAVLLAGIGIHGVLSFAVSQRRQEIGVRIALGAEAGDILAMILRRSLLLAIAGLLPGTLIAYWAATGMQALLAGVMPGDLLTFATAITITALMTVAGSLAPAVKAVKVDPISALRVE